MTNQKRTADMRWTATEPCPACKRGDHTDCWGVEPPVGVPPIGCPCECDKTTGTNLGVVRAASALVDASRCHDGSDTPHSEAIKNAAGVHLFGDERLARLVTCAICGCIGDPDDECGRPPEGHTLRVSR